MEAFSNGVIFRIGGCLACFLFASRAKSMHFNRYRELGSFYYIFLSAKSHERESNKDDEESVVLWGKNSGCETADV
jgi:hypothetical protein